jgi:glycosyltransferase involved in cell wall biosynthesis
MMYRSQARNLFALGASMLTRKSFIIQRDFVPEMAQVIDQLLQKGQFDVVHSDQLWMAQYALRTKWSAPGAMLVLDEHNACFQIIQRLAAREHNLLKRLLFQHEWRRLQEYEAQTCSLFDHLVTVTEEDRSILQDLIESQKKKNRWLISSKTNQSFTTIPICVDTQSITPISPRPGSLNVLHMGTMFFLPNVEGVLWFTREVWPKVVAQIPQATFTIVGKNPPTKIQALCKSQKGISSIQVTGYVPDPMPYLEQAGVFIVPLLSGGGMRVKIIDAWRWGLPIVSTTIGAEGISCQPGLNIMIADNSEAFAQAVVQVLKNPLLAERLRINGRHWVVEHYDWQTVYNGWDSIYPTS